MSNPYNGGRDVMDAVRVSVTFCAGALQAMRLQSGRSGNLDLFSSRLVKAASEPTLAGACESLLRSIDADPDSMHPPHVAQMVAVAGSPDGPRVLRWWREQAKLVTLLAATRKPEDREEAIATITLPPAQGGGRAVPRGSYHIGIRAACETPLVHGADGRAGNATIFRRMDVLGSDGPLYLPYYAGNAVRGQVRDLLADHLLTALGLPADRSRPSVAMWFFYALYSGGALEERSDATKALGKELGNHGAVRAMGIRTFRDMLPGLSLLGCALGNRVLPGHCQFADLRPVCYEWGTGDTPVAEMLTWDYLTRREDHEDHVEHHGMIANSEVLRVGAELEGGVDHDGAMPDIEVAALGRGLLLLQERGMLGGENRRGFGRVRVEIEDCPDPSMYDSFLAERRSDVLSYLRSVDALPELSLGVA